MRVTAGLDSGPVCAQETEPVAADDNYGTLSHRLQERGGELLVTTLEQSPSCAEQDHSQATYAEKITGEDRVLDAGRPAVELERRIRALTPHVGAHLELSDGTWLGVRQARVLATRTVLQGSLSLDGPRPVLGCARGALELAVVQPPGRRPMSGEDFLHGRRR
jgi:methionyl-tRNA formyltransferase